VTIEELLTDLRLDLGDSGGELLNDDYLKRCILKAIPIINSDINTDYIVSGDALFPAPEDVHRELVLLRSQAFACSLMRSITANNFSFSSGNKKVDKTKQPEFWKEQEETLLVRYKARVRTINPDNTTLDDSILATGSLTPLIYEIESEEPCPC
jgi:hypothetical protein